MVLSPFAGEATTTARSARPSSRRLATLVDAPGGAGALRLACRDGAPRPSPGPRTRTTPRRATATGAPARSLVLLALFAVWVIWGSTYLAIKLALGSLPPFLMGGARSMIAGTLLLGGLRLGGVAGPDRAAVAQRGRDRDPDGDARERRGGVGAGDDPVEPGGARRRDDAALGGARERRPRGLAAARRVDRARDRLRRRRPAERRRRAARDAASPRRCCWWRSCPGPAARS